MGEVINFNPSGDRNVADTLREVARAIDAGEIKPDLIYIAMAERISSDTTDYIWSVSSMSKLERIGLLAKHLHYANG